MVSLLTALIIQNNDIDIHPYQDRESKKWGFELARMERGNYRPTITCDAIYDSKQTARQEGENLVTDIRALDLGEERKKIEDSLGPAKDSIQKIVSAVNPERGKSFF